MKTKKEEALELSEEIIKNIELDEIPLRNILLKCARLARLTGVQNAIDLFNYELSGYPKDANGYILSSAFQLARNVNRIYKAKNNSGIEQEFIFTDGIAELEAELEAAKQQMLVAHDSNVSISSSNPTQYVMSPMGNTFERLGLRQTITDKSKKLHLIKNGYYSYVSSVYNQYKFEEITDNIFQRKKLLVDEEIGKKVPDAVQKLVAVYENLNSNNNEDWANAVHSCRRVIKDVADVLYPANNQELKLPDNKTIKLNDDNYIIRLKEYIKQKNDSENFRKVVGSHLDFIGDRIDSIYKNSTKGSHDKVDKEEAERYVIYTYLLLADILSL